MRIRSELPTRETAIDLALARSVMYRTLSLGFHEPTAEGVAWLMSATARQSLVAAAELVDSVAHGFAEGAERFASTCCGFAEGAGRFASTCRDAKPILPAALGFVGMLNAEPRDVAATFQRLFGHTARGLVCPLETEYGLDAAFQQPQALADIAGYYLAFGLRPRSRADYRVDHVGCECEFMDFLSRKEALMLQLCSDVEVAERDDQRETLDQTRHAARKFMRDHLGRFGRAFASRLDREANGEFFGALGDLLFSLIGSECARFGIPPGAITLELRSTVPDDVPMACGTAQELIQIQRRAPVEGR